MGKPSAHSAGPPGPRLGSRARRVGGRWSLRDGAGQGLITQPSLDLAGPHLGSNLRAHGLGGTCLCSALSPLPPSRRVDYIRQYLGNTQHLEAFN